MIELLQRLTKMLAETKPDAHRIAEQLGEIQGGGEANVPYKVVPADKTIQEIRVVHNAKTGEPSQVILIPAAPLAMKKLTAVFGEYNQLPRLPNPKESPRVSFDVDTTNSEHPVSVLASYDTEDDDPSGSDVVKVIVIRG